MSDLWGLHIAGNPTYDDFMQSVNARPTGPQKLHRGVGLLKDSLDPDLHERLHRAVTTGQPDPDLIHHVLHHIDREGQGMGEYWSALPEDATSYSLTAALPGQNMAQPGYMIRKAPADYHVLISSDWDGQGGQIAHPDQDDNVYKLNPGSGLKVRSVKVRRGGRSGKDWGDWVDLGGDSTDGIRYAAADHLMVPVEHLLPHAIYDLVAATDADYFPNLVHDLKHNGPKMPVTMETDGHLGLLGDGTHRLAAAREAGLTHLPVRFLRESTRNLSRWGGEPLHDSIRQHLADNPDAIQESYERQPSWQQGEYDGIRYAHIVEADVAEDLIRLGMAWQDWAPQVQGGCKGCSGGGDSGEFYIQHDSPGKIPGDDHKGRSSLNFYHDTGLDGQPELYISGIHTNSAYQRDGVAEALIRHLHDNHPNMRINPGFMTSDGQAFHDKMVNKEPSAKSMLAGIVPGPGDLRIPADELWSYAQGRVDPTNPYNARKLEQLERGGVRDGIHTPVSVATDGSRAAIVDGLHRAWWALQNGMPDVPVVVAPPLFDLSQEGGQVGPALAEHLSRQPR